MSEIPQQERMRLSIEAFTKGQFKSKNACAKAFDIPPSTYKTPFNGAPSRKETIANCRNYPLQISNVRHLAQLVLSARLKSSQDAFISEG